MSRININIALQNQCEKVNYSFELSFVLTRKRITHWCQNAEVFVFVFWFLETGSLKVALKANLCFIRTM